MWGSERVGLKRNREDCIMPGVALIAEVEKVAIEDGVGGRFELTIHAKRTLVEHINGWGRRRAMGQTYGLASKNLAGLWVAAMIGHLREQAEANARGREHGRAGRTSTSSPGWYERA